MPNDIAFMKAKDTCCNRQSGLNLLPSQTMVVCSPAALFSCGPATALQAIPAGPTLCAAGIPCAFAPAPLPGPPPHPTTTICPIISVPTWKQSYGMEQVWTNEFNRLFLQFLPQLWHLSPVEQKPLGTWYTFVDSAKVRFCCEECGHGWTSMKGRVTFWFGLHSTLSEGTVVFKLYGQQCQKCKSGRFEPAMWYPEEVVKVLINIYHRIGQVYYGFHQPPIQKNRRAGKPRNPHNSELCQACADGVCAERK